MKLLINRNLKAYFEVDIEYFQDLIAEMRNDYCIFCEVKADEFGVFVKVLEQKITLDEVAMNHVFSDLLIYFDYNLRYAALGGKGCNMALVIE